MATCDLYTKQSNSTCPRVHFEVWVTSEDATKVYYDWYMYYDAFGYAANTNGVARSCTATVGGDTLTGSININGVKGTKLINSGSSWLSKEHGSRWVSCSVSFYLDVTWSGTYNGTVTASGGFYINPKTSYSVTYNANGGSGAPSAQTKWYGENLTISSTKPTRTGYSFQGWGTTASDTSVNYAAGATYSSNAAAPLYAIWKANTYTVTYNANGGSGAPSAQTKTYGVDLTLSSTKPTRTNYNFLGWSTSSTASSAQYASGGKYTANSAVTLYAVWELAYWKPKITNLLASRSTSNGTIDDFNTYAKVTFDFELCQITGENNPKTVVIGYKLPTTTSYTDVTVPNTSYSVTETTSDSKKYSVDHVIGGSLDTEKSYDIRVTITDDKGGSNPLDTSIGSSAFAIDILAEGKGVAFGKAASTPNIVDSAWRFQTTTNGITSTIGAKNSTYCHYETTAPNHYFNKPLRVKGNVYAGTRYDRQLAYIDSTPQLREKTAIASSADLNTLTTPGTYGCLDATAKTLKNCPITTGFSMVVSHSYGSNISTNTYIDQEIHVSYHETIYRRRYNASSSSWSAWRCSRSYVGTGDSKVLASTGSYMHGSQELVLSEKISDQPNGIVLVWSYYSDGVYNSNFSHHFVPKHFVQAHPKGGMWCTAIGIDYNMAKYVYIYDTKIVGHADNTLNGLVNDIYIHNGNYCLRYVIGV